MNENELVCMTCKSLSRNTRLAGHAHLCLQWHFTITDDAPIEWMRTDRYFCAHHSLGPGKMTKIEKGATEQKQEEHQDQW